MEAVEDKEEEAERQEKEWEEAKVEEKVDATHSMGLLVHGYGEPTLFPPSTVFNSCFIEDLQETLGLKSCQHLHEILFQNVMSWCFTAGVMSSEPFGLLVALNQQLLVVLDQVVALDSE